MSRFVSGGQVDAPTERDAEWLAAQARIEQSVAAKKAINQPEAMSLYDTLQANKQAKQEAFEESIKLKHQFRALDDDEANFLNTITKTERDAEAQRRRDDAKRLEEFRAAREQAEREANVDDEPKVGDENWEAGRKRKRERKGLIGVKARKVEAEEKQSSKADEQEKNGSVAPVPPPKAGIEAEAPSATTTAEDSKATTTAPPKTGGLGLTGYGSDSDDD